MSDPADENFQFQKVVVVLGFTLLIIKYVAYWLSGSVAIFTDATESIVNVVAACVGMYALYMSAKPADRDHPFGHGKIEIVSSAIEGTMIMVAGLLIIRETILSFIDPGDISDGLDIGLVLVAISAVANYAVGRIAIRKGRRNRSPALEASGKHLCSDTYSSVGILLGLVVVFVAQGMGYDARWLDSTIAAVFGAIIIYTGIGVLRRAVNDTMDTADDELLEQVAETINGFRHDHWIDVYNLRIIKYGPQIFVDLKVVLPRGMTVENMNIETGEIAEALSSKYGNSVEVSINPVACMPFHCRYCTRECTSRCGPFRGSLEWNTDVLECTAPHSPVSFVVWDDGVDST